MKLTLPLFAATIIAFSICIPANGQTNSSQEYDSSWTASYEPFRIAGNLYYVGTYDLACYLIVTNKGNILINTGVKGSASLIRQNIETLGFKFSDIKILLSTQAHLDHVADLAEIKRRTNAQMMIHEEDAQVLADGGKSDFLYGGSFSFEGLKADVTFKDGHEIRLGDTKLTALHHPGHTKGATSFLLDVQDEKRTWTVLIVNIPSILPQTRLMGMPSYPKVGEDYKRTLEALSKLKFDLWVASHASQFGLHDKRKPGDPYRPEVFADRPGYEASINTIRNQYQQRLKSEQKK